MRWNPASNIDPKPELQLSLLLPCSLHYIHCSVCWCLIGSATTRGNQIFCTCMSWRMSLYFVNLFFTNQLQIDVAFLLGHLCFSLWVKYLQKQIKKHFSLELPVVCSWWLLFYTKQFCLQSLIWTLKLP